jgi:hypothetical protein
MCCEGTAVGLKLPEDGVNKYQNVQEQDPIIYEGRNCVAHVSW